MQGFIKAVGAGKRRARNLARPEACQAFSALLETQDDAQVGAFLLAMRMKGETGEELAGFVDALLQVEPSEARSSIDVDAHGDGHKGRPSLLPAAVALAGQAGADVHVRIDRTNPRAQHHLGFVFDHLGALHGVTVRDLGEDHPRLKRLLDMRGRVGVRTCVSSVVKLWSPRSARVRIVGIFHGPYHEPMAQALALLGAHGLVIQAPGGLPEPPIGTRSKYTSSEAPGSRQELDARTLVSADKTLPPCATAAEALALNQEALRGVRGPARAQAELAASLFLVTAGLATDLASGIERTSRVVLG